MMHSPAAMRGNLIACSLPRRAINQSGFPQSHTPSGSRTPLPPVMSNITIIGAGTIGLSFCALHLTHHPTTRITIHDPRPDLNSHIETLLPGYLLGPQSHSLETLLSTGQLRIAATLEQACSSETDIVQEQGPENPAFKTSLWPQVEALVGASCLLWSSTSGIPASVQSARMKDPGRLLVVHPFNPPHIMPLIEVVPSPATPEQLVQAAVRYFDEIGHRPVVLRHETTGFVANRLAFVLLREACHLVREGVVGVRDVDTIVENSLGLRWSVKGPFASYHDGGGKGGLEAFMANVGGTIQDVWDSVGTLGMEDESLEGGGRWRDEVVRQTREAYGEVTERNFEFRDRATRRALESLGAEKARDI